MKRKRDLLSIHLENLLISIEGFMNKVIEKPEKWLDEKEKTIFGEEAIKITKLLFDFSSKLGPRKMSPLKELFIEQFDSEQIWQQMQLQFKPLLSRLQRKGDELYRHGMKRNENSQECECDHWFISNEMSSNQETERTEESINEQMSSPKESISESISTENSVMEEKPTKSSKKLKSDKGNDIFFNPKQMYEFLEEGEREFFQEKEETDEDFESEVEQNSDEDDIDGDDDSIETESKSNRIMYKNFFDDPPTKDDLEGYESEILEENEEKNGKKTHHHSRRKSSLFDKQQEEKKVAVVGNDKEETSVPSTIFDKRTAKLAEEIERLETELVKEKSWEVSGEISGRKRPENSLLEVTLDFDQIRKAPPVITEEFTSSLEELIKKRIQESIFDDVIRKKAPEKTKFKRPMELDTEKSKIGLADIYAQEYEQKVLGNGKEDSLKVEHEEIEELFKTLCIKLDTLSNFHYTPKLPKEEIQVRPNVASIASEEVIPIAVSDASLVAPEELYESKGNKELKNTTELSQEDRKRLRAHRKREKKLRKLQEEAERKLSQKLNPNQAKLDANRKDSKAKALKKIQQGKNVTIAKNSQEEKRHKSSGLFQKLQEESVKEIMDRKSNKKDTNGVLEGSLPIKSVSLKL